LEETGIRTTAGRLVLVDARPGRDVSFVFRGEATGGELDPQLGEIAEAGWIERDEIARSSPRLHRLLEWIDAAGEGVSYVR
jgi:ADP-ribose pyrophosphatase YjhB (NUDIX family)